MLTIVYGPRGTGKSKRICGDANEKASAAKGSVVFIDKDNDHMYGLNRNMRFINAAEYNVTGKDMLLGFITGIAASDFDLCALYINGFAKLLNSPIEEAEDVITAIEAFSEKFGVYVMLSVNAGDLPCPEYMRKYCL